MTGTARPHLGIGSAASTAARCRAALVAAALSLGIGGCSGSGDSPARAAGANTSGGTASATDAAGGSTTAPTPEGRAPTAAGGATSQLIDGAPRGQLPGTISPRHYALDLKIDPRATRFSGTVAIDVALALPAQRIWLDGLGLDVTEAYAVESSGQRVDATFTPVLDSGVASLTFEHALEAGPTTLHFAYSAPFHDSANALFRAERDGAAYVASQLEPIAARQVFPGFDDVRFKTPWDISITARAEDTAVTNTPEIRTTALEDGWVRHDYATTEPLPTYLLAFAVGPYDVVEADPIPPTDLRAHSLPLRGVAVRGLGPRFDFALDETPAVVDWLEGYFGMPYPYEKLDLIALPTPMGGAMENAGAVTYDESLILLGGEPPLQQRRTHLSVHAHELAHMWFGDLVTPTWWTDAWLNEAFASWMAGKAADALWPEGNLGRETLNDALSVMSTDSLASTRRIREPVLRDESIMDAFDPITYLKGAGVLAMFESYLGENTFRAGVRLYLQRFSKGSADAEDFMQALEQASQERGIADAFRSFIEQPGVPVVSAELTCGNDRGPRVRLSQRRHVPLGSTIDANAQQWQIPVCVAYETKQGPGRACDLLDTREATFDLGLNECPSAIHPNSHGAGYYRFALSERGWSGLVARAHKLDAPEALTLVDSLSAAFDAGDVSAESLVQGLVALADHPAWDVASATVVRFTHLLAVLPPADRTRLEPVLRAVYRPKYDALARKSDQGSRLLERNLLGFLALDVRDPEIRAQLGKLAAEYVGLNGKPNPAAVSPDSLGTVLAVGAQTLGAPFFDRLAQAALSSQDPYFRDTAFGALGRVEDAELTAALRANLLDRRFPPLNEAMMILTQLHSPVTRAATWDWVRANADVVIGLTPEFLRTRIVTGFGGAFCSSERAAELKTFVTDHAAAIPGYERGLDQIGERIALCAALRSARGTELAEAIARL